MSGVAQCECIMNHRLDYHDAARGEERDGASDPCRDRTNLVIISFLCVMAMFPALAFHCRRTPRLGLLTMTSTPLSVVLGWLNGEVVDRIS